MAGRKPVRPATERAQAEVKAPQKPLLARECRTYMRERLAEAFPRIVDGFVKQAEGGSCSHVKLASELLEQRPAKKTAERSRKKGSAERMLEMLGGEGQGTGNGE